MFCSSKMIIIIILFEQTSRTNKKAQSLQTELAVKKWPIKNSWPPCSRRKRMIYIFRTGILASELLSYSCGTAPDLHQLPPDGGRVLWVTRIRLIKYLLDYIKEYIREGVENKRPDLCKRLYFHPHGVQLLMYGIYLCKFIRRDIFLTLLF